MAGANHAQTQHPLALQKSFFVCMTQIWTSLNSHAMWALASSWSARTAEAWILIQDFSACKISLTK